MRFLGVLLLAAASGAVLACAVAALAVFVRGEFPHGVAISPVSIGIIASWGAYIGIMIALLSPPFPVLGSLRAVVVGSVFCIFTVGVVTYEIACELGGGLPKAGEAFFLAALPYGIPVGLVVGAIAGLITYKNTREPK